MRPNIPDSDDLDEEIRGHLALSIKERIERGEDPAAARLAALKEFGNVTLTRDSMRGVWRPRWLDAAEALGRDIRFAVRSLMRAKGLAATVVVTLALGIGANAAIFSVVRGVLLRPLVNRDEDRLIYIRQSAPGLGAENMTFSVPEINDLKSRVTTISAFGDFSTADFTMIGLSGEPRTGEGGRRQRLVLRRHGTAPRARPPAERARRWAHGAPGAVVLTHRFWTTSLNSDPAVIGKTIRLGARSATGGRRPRAVGPLSGRHRDHRERRDQPASPRSDDGHEPYASYDAALRPPRARGVPRNGARRADGRARRHHARASRGVFGGGRCPAEGGDAPRSNRGAGAARSCSCCWPRPRSCSSSRARMSPT